MERLTTLLIFFLLSTLLIAQSWAEVESTWCFEKSQFIGGNYGGCECWNYSNDSIVNGQTYQTIQGVWYAENYYSETITEFPQEDILFRLSGDSLLQWYDGAEHLLADFGASPGDSWSVTPIPTSMGYQGEDYTIVVDSTFTSLYGTVFRTTIAYSTVITNPEYAGCEETISGTIVEGLYFSIGGLENILPSWPDSQCTFDANDILSFSFHESAVSLEYIGEGDGSYDCQSVVGLSTQSLIALDLWPTIVTDHINLTLPHLGASQLTIYNVQGQTQISRSLHSKDALATHRIDLSDLSRGVYLVELTSDIGRGVSRILKQ